MASPPATPSPPTRLNSLCTVTSIGVEWQAVSPGPGFGGQITGYILYMAKGEQGSFSLLFDGRSSASILYYVADGLETGEIYRFKVSANNYNGEGTASSEMTTYSCVAPDVMTAPARVTSTKTSFELEWTEPGFNGGCPVTSYAVFRDAGDGGLINQEVNSVQDTNIRDKPTLQSMVVTHFPTSPTSMTF